MSINCGEKLKLGSGGSGAEDREEVGGAVARSLIWKGFTLESGSSNSCSEVGIPTLGRSVHFISSLPEVEPLVS